MLFILSGLLLSLNTFFLYKIVELTSDSSTVTNKNDLRTAYVLLVMGFSEVFGAIMSGNISDFSSDYFSRNFCFFGYFLVIIIGLITIKYKFYWLAFFTGVLTGFFNSAHNTII